MKKNDFLFICDFETTGINPEVDYPIELGGLLTDRQLNVIAPFEALIKIPETCFVRYNNDILWHPKYTEAYKVHQITPHKILQNGLQAKDVVLSLKNLIYTKTYGKFRRIVILSDNAQFEYNFMKKLFKMADMENNWFFHYSAWDTNICLDLFDFEIGDAIPVHRALQDTFRLYRQIVRFAEKYNFLKK